MDKYQTLDELYVNDIKTRQGEVILPGNFGKFKYKYHKTPNFWVHSQKMPKTYYKSDSNINNTKSELLYSLLAKEFHMDVVNAVPAIRVNRDNQYETGVLVENFVTYPKITKYYAGSTLISEYAYETNQRNTLENFMLAYQGLAHINKLFTKKQVVTNDKAEEKLALMHMLDILTFNTDRHPDNIGALKIKTKQKIFIDFTKIFDNSFAFKLNFFKRNGEKKFEVLYKEQFEKFNYFQFTINLKSKTNYFTFDQVAKEFAIYMHTKPEIYQVFQQILNYDINQLFKKLAQTYPGYEISEKEKEFVTDMFDYSRSKMQSFYKNYQPTIDKGRTF